MVIVHEDKAKGNVLHQAQRFDEVWRAGDYRGFSRETEYATTTPLLEAFLRGLSAAHKPLQHVVEGGAGCGSHTITLVRAGYRVTAVEYSPAAAQQIKALAEAQPCSYRQWINVFQGDLLAYLRNGTEAMGGFYANSVLHFFAPHEREEVYALLCGHQPKQGLIAVSFKAQGDALEKKGEVVETTPAGNIVRHADDGIERLFVKDPLPLIKELEEAGYVVNDDGVYRWKVQGYNYKGEAGCFIGFLAQKR